jgi:hypothetical protein
LLDECVDWRLSRTLTGHEVRSARQMGWSAIKNGELLALASERFDAFVTVDRNLAFQQNVRSLSIAVIVLHAKTNRLADLLPLVPNLLTAIGSAKPGVASLFLNLHGYFSFTAFCFCSPNPSSLGPQRQDGAAMSRSAAARDQDADGRRTNQGESRF